MSLTDSFLDEVYFDDIDHFNQTIKEWDLQFLQLERGKIKAYDRQFNGPGFQLGYCTADKKLEQTGTSPDGVWSFGFITGAPIVWKGMEVLPDQVIVLKPGSELNGIGRSDFRVITIGFPESVLEQVCEEHELPETMRIIRENDLIRMEKWKKYQFTSKLLEVLAEFQFNPFSLDSTGYVELSNVDLPLEFCQLIEGPGKMEKIYTSKSRESIIKKTNQFLSESSSDPIKISDLCRITGVSERTLQYSFKEYYGISPKAYLKAKMLNKVHFALRQANPNLTSVADVAYQWGFWHMGQFAADYRRMFGKYPSETLGKL